MEYRPLGRTGISVSQMCLGAMMFGAFGNSDHDDAAKIIHKALDAGINFIDTADGYSAGESEEILGEALAGGRRESDEARKGIARAIEKARQSSNRPAIRVAHSSSSRPRSACYFRSSIQSSGL